MAKKLFSKDRQPKLRPKFGKQRTILGEVYELVLELGADDSISLVAPFREDYRSVRVIPSTTGGRGVYVRGYEPGWRKFQSSNKPKQGGKRRYLGKLEKTILNLLYVNNDWMKTNFRYSFSPHILMPNTSSMSLMPDRRHVNVYGLCTQNAAIKMFKCGDLKGSYAMDDSWGKEIEMTVTIELDGKAAKAAMDCNTGRDLIYIRGEGWVYRRQVQGVA